MINVLFLLDVRRDSRLYFPGCNQIFSDLTQSRLSNKILPERKAHSISRENNKSVAEDYLIHIYLRKKKIGDKIDDDISFTNFFQTN